jgi:hypothetical protein
MRAATDVVGGAMNEPAATGVHLDDRADGGAPARENRGVMHM